MTNYFLKECDVMTVVYKPSEVMKRLGLKESVFKKYYLALEKEGYVIERNASNHRVFTEEDVETFETFMELIKYDGMTIESVAKKIGAMKGHNDITKPKTNDYDVMALIAVALEERDKQHALQLKQQEEQFADRMQKALSDQLKLQEREITANFKSEFNKFKDSLEETIGELIPKEKKPWWKKFFDSE
jgi:DNA-binding transcriptional MerR regulator